MALRGIQEYIARDANNILLSYDPEWLPAAILFVYRQAERRLVRSSRMRTVETLLLGHPFCIRKMALQEGCPLVRGKNQYIYV